MATKYDGTTVDICNLLSHIFIHLLLKRGEERSVGRFLEQKSVAKDSAVSKDAKVCQKRFQAS
ncbi:hypothetical protein CFP56_043548 [Quercus suber]|uniref:Uncharacterized protein n=1 Tax=Quercus suber TaxID=58331 RepID=A0AAW0IRH0_QUESU